MQLVSLVRAAAEEVRDELPGSQLPGSQQPGSQQPGGSSSSSRRRPRKLVVFAHHERVMDSLEETIRMRLRSALPSGGGGGAKAGGGGAKAGGYECVRIDGSHTAMGKNALLDRFRDDDTCLVALLSIKACGTGVDGLQHRADHAVFVELPETYALAHQAASRLHRSGQQHKVRLTWLLACAPPRRGRLDTDQADNETSEDEAAALLRVCQGADTRQWASLYRNSRQIDEVFSGSVQRSASGSYTTTTTTTTTSESTFGAASSAEGAHREADDELLSDSMVGALLFGVSPHTRYVHVFASSTSAVSMAAFAPTELAELMEEEGSDGDEPPRGMPQLAAAAARQAPPPAATRHEQLRRAAAAFKRAWEAQPAHGRPFSELPCTLAALPLQCTGLRGVLNDSRLHSRQRHAPRLAPSESEQASLPAGAVWIPAAVRESRTGTFEVTVHWQPFAPPSAQSGRGGAGQSTPEEPAGVLLCANRACYRPLDGRTVVRGRTNHPLPTLLPPRGDVGWHTEHEDVLGLVCGGPCLKAHRLARDPTAVRREVRKYHVRLSSTVFCQHCGVDVLILVAQLRGLESLEERRQLLLSRIPHLVSWPGKTDRACREPSEGHIWEADHRLEVRDGGGEASSVDAFDPLCIGCHQRKTNETTCSRAGGLRAAAAGGGGAGGSDGGCDGGGMAEARRRCFSLRQDAAPSAGAPAARARGPEAQRPRGPGGQEARGPSTPSATSGTSRKRKAAGSSSSLGVEGAVAGARCASAGASPQSSTVSVDAAAAMATPAAAPQSVISVDLTADSDEEEAQDKADGEEGEDDDNDDDDKYEYQQEENQQEEEEDEEDEEDEGEDEGEGEGEVDNGADDFDAVLAKLPAAMFDARTYAARASSAADTAAATAAASAVLTPPPPPMPMPMPPRSVAPMAVWEVELTGSYRPYEEAEQRTLEAAFQRGEASARITVRGSAYDVTLRGDDRRQRGVGTEAWRRRRVRRRWSI